jgi:hypothetical protein
MRTKAEKRREKEEREKAGMQEGGQMEAVEQASSDRPRYADWSWLRHINLGSDSVEDGLYEEEDESDALDVVTGAYLTRHNLTQHQYQWPSGPDRVSRYHTFLAQRTPQGAANGSEKLPGGLLAPFTSAHLNQCMSAKMLRFERLQSDWPSTPLALHRHLLLCLRRHYLFFYFEQLTEDPRFMWTANEQRVLKAAMQNGLDNSSSGALTALDKRNHINWLNPSIAICNSMVLAGETFGSIRGTSKNFYAYVQFNDNKIGHVYYYGEILFFVRHIFEVPVSSSGSHGGLQRKEHCFALMRWYDTLQRDALVHHCSSASLCQRFPVVSPNYWPTHVQDLVPIGRICGRWIPRRGKWPGGRDVLHVCPIPSRVHA